MKHAYNPRWLDNLDVVKESTSWRKSGVLSHEQLAAIRDAHQSGFFHPNVMIRILLFLSSIIALSGVTGILFLMVAPFPDNAYPYFCFLYGAGSLFLLEHIFIQRMGHFKSGVNEAILYHAVGFAIGGIAGIAGFNAHVALIACIAGFSFAAYRYLDLISTAGALCSLGGLLFYELYLIGGIVQQLIPLIFIVLFTYLYFYFRKLKERPDSSHWENCLLLSEALCLLTVYASGNYFVVRELSISLLDLEPGAGEDIPFAYLFYGLTVIMPVLYLYTAIRKRDLVMIRVGLAVTAFSAFTFKYYFSLGRPELTLTAAGGVMLVATLLLIRYLKTPRQGYTREKILDEKWGDANAEAFAISQGMGGNAMPEEAFKGGGGEFGGGGASGNY